MMFIHMHDNVLFHEVHSHVNTFLFDRWAGQALFGTLTPDIIVLTLLYSIAGVSSAHVIDIHLCHKLISVILILFMF